MRIGVDRELYEDALEDRKRYMHEMISGLEQRFCTVFAVVENEKELNAYIQPDYKAICITTKQENRIVKSWWDVFQYIVNLQNEEKVKV